jgi:hypothetical protein
MPSGRDVQRLQRFSGSDSAAAAEIARSVQGDTREPGRQRLPIIVSFQRLPRGEERILGRIVRILRVAQYCPRESSNHCAMTDHERPEGVPVTR